MKICDKCGAVNSDDRFFCVDCEEKLGDSISEEHEALITENTRKTTEKLYNRNDPLHISLFDKIIGYICLISVILSVIFLIVFLFQKKETDALWLSIIFGICGIIDALLPNIIWSIERLRLSLYVNNSDDLSPGNFYMISKKFSEAICALVCIAFTVFSIIYLFKPPVVKYAYELGNYYSDGTSNQLYTGVHTTQIAIRENPEIWKKIIKNNDYTVEAYTEYLKNSNNYGEVEHIMVEAMLEIAELEGDALDYINSYAFLTDFEFRLSEIQGIPIN